MLTFLPTARLQEFDNSGRILANGYIVSYELKTTTPKPLYKDVDGIAKHANPCYLDSNGSQDIYLLGNYTLYLFDRNGVQVGSPIDIVNSSNTFITSGGSAGWADNIILSVNNYDSVRALTNPYSVIFVQGRENQADGGEGWFYFDSSSTLADDDGIVLTPATAFGRYIRLDVVNINPEWFGLVYNSNLDQSNFITKTEIAAAQHSKPIEISDVVYINSNYTTSGSQFIFSDSSKLTSTLAVNFTFDSASSISYIGRRIFGNSVQPIFQRGSTDNIRYSWMDADNNEGRWQKFLTASSSEITYILDEDIILDSDVVIPNNSKLIFENSSRISLTGESRDVNIPKLENANLITSAVYFPTSASIGSIDLNYAEITPKFFCGLGTSVTSATSAQDYIGLMAAFKSGNVYIDDTYTIAEKHVIGNDVTIKSNIPQSIVSSAVTNYPHIDLTTSGHMISALGTITFDSVGINMSKGSRIHHFGSGFFNNSVFYAEPAYYEVSGISATSAVSATSASFVSITISGTSAIFVTSGTSARGIITSDTWQYFTNSRIGENIVTMEVLDAVTFDNVIKEDEPNKRFYKDNTQFKNVYLENEIETHDYDNILVTNNDGLVFGKSDLTLNTISAVNVYTNYQPKMASKTISATSYTIQDSDPSILICDTVAAGGAITVTIPASAGVSTSTRIIVNAMASMSGPAVFVTGDMWGGIYTFKIPESLFHVNNSAVLTFAGGKWAIS